MNCIKCNYKIEIWHNYCVVCGTKINIKKCKYCNNNFVLKRTDTIYCKNCCNNAYKTNFNNKMINNKEYRNYRNTYMAKQLKVKRNPHNEQYKKEFEEFKQNKKSRW